MLNLSLSPQNKLASSRLLQNLNTKVAKEKVQQPQKLVLKNVNKPLPRNFNISNANESTFSSRVAESPVRQADKENKHSEHKKPRFLESNGSSGMTSPYYPPSHKVAKPPIIKANHRQSYEHHPTNLFATNRLSNKHGQSNKMALNQNYYAPYAANQRIP